MLREWLLQKIRLVASEFQQPLLGRNLRREIVSRDSLKFEFAKPHCIEKSTLVTNRGTPIPMKAAWQQALSRSFHSTNCSLLIFGSKRWLGSNDLIVKLISSSGFKEVFE
jgi:hypothetical protein